MFTERIQLEEEMIKYDSKKGGLKILYTYIYKWMDMSKTIWGIEFLMSSQGIYSFGKQKYTSSRVDLQAEGLNENYRRILHMD